MYLLKIAGNSMKEREYTYRNVMIKTTKVKILDNNFLFQDIKRTLKENDKSGAVFLCGIDFERYVKLYNHVYSLKCFTLVS